MLKSNPTAPWIKARSEAKERVQVAFVAIYMHKNEVRGYAYNDDNMLATEIECILATEIEHILVEQLFKDSTDGLTGLLSTAKNTLTEYKVTSSIKRKDGEKAEMASRQEMESAYATTKIKRRIRNRH